MSYFPLSLGFLWLVICVAPVQDKTLTEACVLFTVPYKPPANVTGMATNSTSIFVEWDSVDLPNIRGILRGYTVFYEETQSSFHPSVLRNISMDISVTEAQLVNLHKYTEYRIWVTAFTTRNGLPSNSLFIRTHEDSKFQYCYLFPVTRIN